MPKKIRDFADATKAVGKIQRERDIEAIKDKMYTILGIPALILVAIAVFRIRKAAQK